MKRLITAIAAATLFTGFAQAQVTPFDKIPESVTLFKNVKVFDGHKDELQDLDVLVVKNKIHKMGKNLPTQASWEIDVKTGGAKQIKSPIGGLLEYTFTTYKEEKKVKKTVKVNVIDGGGRTLMPGLIDSHVHVNMYMDGTVATLEAACDLVLMNVTASSETQHQR